MQDVREIAKYIISYFSNIPTNEVEGGLTNLKLQKLLFYVQVLSLKRYKKPAFSNTIEAWSYGPVVPDVYQDYKIFGKKILDIEKPSMPLKSIALQNVVDDVIEAKGKYTGYALMKMTHNESVWKQARNNDKIITDDAIQASFHSI